MDYSFSKENEEFRQNVREFVKSEWDADLYHMNDVANASWHLDDPKALAASESFRESYQKRAGLRCIGPKNMAGSLLALPRI